jgi:hypothetical protein
MAIVRQTVNGHVYLYESRSYRNEKGEPRNKKKIIGKIDPTTGKPQYKEEYLERMKAESGIAPQPDTEPSYTLEAIRKSTVKNYGAFHLFNHIAEKTGLMGILRDVFPGCWQQILSIACYLVSSGEPVAYCSDWAQQTETFAASRLSPSAITELFKEITVGERDEFYARWAEYRSEQEYLALDITSVSSYSELIGYVEWGYNRDKEKLAQINLCLLMGEESGLPVFQTVYNGSLKDVSTLKTTLKLLTSFSMDKISLVMDKGFCSTKNINELFKHKNIRFLIAVPFSLSFAKERVAQEKFDIDRIENTILIGSDSLRGITRECVWGSEKSIFAHVFHNARHLANTKEDLYANLASILDTLRNNPSYNCGKFGKYFRQSASNNCEIRYDEIEKTLQHCGWLVIVSNHIPYARDAISVYRAKDVVEKGFHSMKSNLDLGRLRVHSDDAMQNKVFICFIALILKCFIHRVMLENGLYYSTTMKKLLNTLDKLKLQRISNEHILFPLTKEQKAIYDAFSIAHPV